MKTSPIAQYGMQLTRLGFVNCYLVREADGYTLIDAGLKGSEDAIVAAADETPIRRIVLTHAHIDHVGSVDALMARLPGVALLASERSIRLLRIPPDLTVLPGEVGPVRGKPRGIRSQLTGTIAEGDRVGSLLAIGTPGHMHGHLSFMDERDGTLYAGDEFGVLSGLRVSGFLPWWFPFKAYSSPAVARESAVRLLEYPIARFACGHGPVDEGGRHSLEQAIARAR